MTTGDRLSEISIMQFTPELIRCWNCGGGLLDKYFIDGSNPDWLVCLGCNATTCINPTKSSPTEKLNVASNTPYLEQGEDD